MDTSLVRRLNHYSSLPTLPATAARILDLAGGANDDFKQVVDFVALDPGLASKLLKAVDSSHHTASRTAKKIRQAFNVLGPVSTVAIALSFSLLGSLKGKKESEHALLFCNRAILSALACRILAERHGFNPDDLLVAGLLQDIGIVALREALPKEYAELTGITDHEALVQAERRKFGSGHDEVGYWLLKKWRFSEYFASGCISGHADFSQVIAVTPARRCIALSGYLADVFLKPADASRTHKAMERAQCWLGMDAKSTTQTLQEMNKDLEELEDFFGIGLLDHPQLEMIAGAAKRLVTIVNLPNLLNSEKKIKRDELTGTPNRLYFDEVFRKEFSASNKQGWPLVLAFIDIDLLKHVSDTYEHVAGDRTLATVGRVVSSVIRSGDIFSCYQGQKFALLLRRATVEVALIVLNRIREKIESAVKVPTPHILDVTMSAGIASHIDHGNKYAFAQDMLNAADNALYSAKRNGLSRIAIAEKG